MHLCGQTLNGTGWFGVVFDTQDEAKKVMEFLEKGITDKSSVDIKQTECEHEFTHPPLGQYGECIKCGADEYRVSVNKEKGKTDVGKD